MWVEALFARLAARPDAVAFAFGSETLTWGRLDDLSRRFATGLTTLGVQRGDRVASMLPTGLELIVALLGCYRVGAIFVPVNTRFRQAEVAHVLRDSGACRVLVSSDSAHESLIDEIKDAPPRIVTPAAGIGDDDEEGEIEDRSSSSVGRLVRSVVGLTFSRLLRCEPLQGPPAVEDEDIAVLIYTSGTTGPAKGVELSFRAILSNMDALTRLWRWHEDDRLVLALPLYHVHGLGIGVHGTLLRGCTAELHGRFQPAAVAQAINGGGTIFMGVPTMYALLAEAMDSDRTIAPALRKARLLAAGSAPLSPALFDRFEVETGHRILERYGMSETLITLSNPYDGERRPGSVGLPVPGCEVRVVDDEMADVAPGEVGQIIVRGTSLMSGYWGQPDKTAEAFRDGWFVTGDAATVSGDGYVSIVGRRSVDIIKSGGFKISAREIEEVLERDPRVREVAVVGLPHPVWGEEITAFVVPAPGVRPSVLAEALVERCRVSLADYKRVRNVRFVDALPRNALGKVLKHELRG